MNYTHEYRPTPTSKPRMAVKTKERQDTRVWAIIRANQQPVPRDWATYYDDNHIKRLVDPKHLRPL